MGMFVCCAITASPGAKTLTVSIPSLGPKRVVENRTIVELMGIWDRHLGSANSCRVLKGGMFKGRG